MTALTLQARPALGTVFMNQVRSLVARYWGQLLAIGVLTWLYQLAGAWNPADQVSPVFTISTQGGLSFSGGFVFMLVTALWAFRIWGDLQPGKRDSFLSYPVERSVQTAVRLTAGLVLYLAFLIGMWIAGMVFVEICYPGSSWLSNPLHQGGGWIVSLAGIVNAYLLASCFALLLRQPELWLFFGLPVGITLLNILTNRLNIYILQEAFTLIFLWPDGLFSGLAIATPDIPPTDSWAGLTSELPDITSVLIWTLILGSVLILASRFRKEA